MQITKYYLYLLIGIIAFASQAIIIKLAYSEGSTPGQFLTIRLFLSVGAIFLISLLTHKGIKLSLSKQKGYFLQGVLGFYLTPILSLLGLAILKANIIAVVTAIFPFFIMILNFIIYGKKPNKKTIIVFFIAHVAIIFLVRDEISNVVIDSLGVLYIFLATLFFALYLILNERGEDEKSLHLNSLLFANLYAFIIAVPLFVVLGDVNFLISKVNIFYIFISAILNLITLFTLSKAVVNIGSTKSSMIMLTEPVITIILAYIILGENLSLLQIVATLVILSCLCSFVREKNQQMVLQNDNK